MSKRSYNFNGDAEKDFSGPSQHPQQAGNKGFQEAQAQVNQVQGIMKDNLNKVVERDHKLSDLNNRAEALRSGAAQFGEQTCKLKRKYWWKNVKMWVIIGPLMLLIIIIIAVWAVTGANV